MRQLQTRVPIYIAYCEWDGSDPMPVEPDESYLFVDVTETPTAQLGDLYDPTTGTWSTPVQSQPE